MDVFAKKVHTPYQQQIFGGRYRKVKCSGMGGRLVLHRRKPLRDPMVARKMAMIRAASPIGRKRVDFNSIR